MNQAQRNYLIEKIKSTSKITIEHLRSSKKESLNLSSYIYHLIMTDKLQIKSEKDILEVIKQKALKAKEGQNWLSGQRDSWSSSNVDVAFRLKEVFIIPEDFQQKIDEIHKTNSEIDEKIRLVALQEEALCLRIQLASDKTLQTMINEIDDMGDISLMDTKLKLLSQ